MAVLAVFALAPAPQDPAPRPTFPEWLEGVRAEALTRGIRPAVLDAAFANLSEPLTTVIDRDRAQPETVLTLEEYLSRVVTEKRMASAAEMFALHRKLLDQVSLRYSVSPRIIVAAWGLESNFGQTSGTQPTIAALATLAWDTRRPTLFRRELLNALEILNRGDIEPANMRGSWAGAMGQPQFMPSSYLSFAQDFDGDGRRDIWSSSADVFASIANFLQKNHWTDGERWGREVTVSAEAAGRIATEVGRRNGSCVARRDMTVAVPMARWQALGVRLPGGRPLPSSSLNAALVSSASRQFLVYRNYEALLEYNCAHSYAISVGLLADSIR